MIESSNLPCVTVEEFGEIVKRQFNEKNYRPIFGLGKGGIGKSESIASLAKELGVGYIDIRLLLYSETDLKGIPYPSSDNTKAIWLQNDILPDSVRDGERGILVLDEITSCGRSVRTAAYQLLNERALGEYKLPEGWLIVCLGNGEEDGGDYNGIEGNFANRCSVYNVVVDVQVWKKWAIENGVNSLVTSFISFKPEYLHTFNPSNETDILFASPRSWKGVSDIINSKGDINDKITRVRIIGNVGNTVGTSFITFCRFSDSIIDPNTILLEGAEPVINQSEVRHLTVGACVKLIHERIELELVNGQEYISHQLATYIANYMKWVLKGMRVEDAVAATQDLLSKRKMEIARVFMMPEYEFNKKCPEFREFLEKHKGVFM